jgi:nicotinamidase-related amidase
MALKYTPKSSPWINSGGYDHDLEFDLQPKKTAFLIIDMQYLDAHPDYGIGADAKKRGVFEEHYAWYFSEVADMLPRLQDLLAACRRIGVEVIHVRIGGLTKDCRDVCLGHKRHELFAPPNSKEAEIIAELAPIDGEIVLTKGTSGVFNGTAIDQILRNMSIENLIVAGVTTNYCVETAVRDACDRSYSVYLLSDGTATMKPEFQYHALEILDNVYCKVKTVDEVITRLEQYAAPVHPLGNGRVVA